MGLAVSWLATVWTEGLLVMRSVNSVFSGVLLSQGQDLQAAGKTIKADKTHTHTHSKSKNALNAHMHARTETTTMQSSAKV